MKLKLAYTPEWYESPGLTSSSIKKNEKPIYHPSLSIEGESAKKLKHLEVGQEIEMTIKVKVSGVNMSEHETEGGKAKSHCSVNFKVMSLECDGPKDDKEDNAESAMDKHRKAYKKK